MTISLRTRLLSGIMLGTAVLLAVFCAAVYSVTRRTMIVHFDASLLSTARMLSAVIEEEGPDSQAGEQTGEYRGDGTGEDGEARDDEAGAAASNKPGLDFEFDVRMTPEFGTYDGGAYYAFYRDGVAVARSPSLGRRDLSMFGDADHPSPAYRRCVLPDGRSGRAICYRFSPRIEDREDAAADMLALVVASEAGQLYGFLALLAWLLAGCSGGIVALSAGIGALVIRAGLRPVHALAREIESVDASSLEKTFGADGCPAELIPICKRLNEMMGRVRASFERQRRFNADVAHELRTPLAGLQSTMEVCLRNPRPPKDYEETLTTCLKIIRPMHRMVDTLLGLARLDSKQVVLKPEAIRLRPLIEETWRPFADRAFDRNVVFENRIGETTTLTCDRDHLAIVLSNIFDNAAQYCDAGGLIVAETQSTPDGMTVAVSNSAAGMTQADARRVFDFFWRADSARTETGLHCGIGLSVVARLAAVLDMKAEAELQPPGLFTIRLRMS